MPSSSPLRRDFAKASDTGCWSSMLKLPGSSGQAQGGRSDNGGFFDRQVDQTGKNA